MEQALDVLRQALNRDDVWLKDIIQARDIVLSRFQPIFTLEHLPALTEDEFRSVLLFKNNHHWPLHRQWPRMCADMPRLRKVLATLLDESQPIGERLKLSSVPGMGRAVITALLHIAWPDRYGVWNNTSEQALKTLDLWPQFERGEAFGGRYVKLNGLLNEVARALKVDLWTLDAAFYAVTEPPTEGDELPGSMPEDDVQMVMLPSSQRFGLERHLHEFLRDNWDHTALGVDWVLYGDPGADDPGYEYPCAVGKIDLLAKHRTMAAWLIVELKRGQGSDQTVGQILRYMGWVKRHLAQSSDDVKGLVIAHESDTRLQYALSAVPSVDLMLYEVQFSLGKPVELDGLQ